MEETVVACALKTTTLTDRRISSFRLASLSTITLAIGVTKKWNRS